MVNKKQFHGSTRERLKDNARGYFNYLTNDRTISPEEKSAIVTRDIQIFMSLAKNYSDASTLKYLKDLSSNVEERKDGCISDIF